ncbi:MAG: chorismate-binding protein [Aphanocapsa feldmannii 277cV]|uniref:Chromophore lyase CpcT/CpeT n=1 Tax=Aphanocapsa feldmannii 277cV TaxID=2507553 RepID=A0A524RLW2_9CHRO|nr:MAG: chorismate-binding protein [Aphanocapsa feldmannii 277cV]
MDRASLLRFCRWLAGSFSNHRQAAENPVDFAHIHIAFRPLPEEHFGSGWYYSEQAYDYDIWTPYRQGVHRVEYRGDHAFVHNFGLPDPVAAAGASRDDDIRAQLRPQGLSPRAGCAMVFRLTAEGHFIGRQEPGCKCLIPRNGRISYLFSEVRFDEQHWVSRDRGFDPESHEQLWGSEHGHLVFERTASFAAEVPEHWLAELSSGSRV